MEGLSLLPSCALLAGKQHRYVNEWVWLGPATDVNKDLQRKALGRVLFEVTVYCPLVPVPSRQHCFQDIPRLHTTAGRL